jgi:hypothetical protein
MPVVNIWRLSKNLGGNGCQYSTNSYRAFEIKVFSYQGVVRFD